MNKPKIAILGANGMLGKEFLEKLSVDDRFEIKGFAREDFDVLDEVALEKFLGEFCPEVIVNCVAYTSVDDAETEREKAFEVNSRSVELLTRFVDAKIIHFSTDYVFDGSNDDGYTEDTIPSPVNVYGESKLAGEAALKNATGEWSVVRTSWLYGKNGKNFVDTMLKLAKERDQIDVVSDQVGSPTYSIDLVNAVVSNFLEPVLDGRPFPQGIFHLTNAGTCSWFDFAKEIFALNRIAINVAPVDSEKFPRPAKRPKFSILLNTKLPELRSWKVALKDYLT